jgi:hypothetical protein
MNERIKELMEQAGIYENRYTAEKFAALVEAAARADEREGCAKLCEEDGLLWGQRYAAAIRARGTT